MHTVSSSSGTRGASDAPGTDEIMVGAVILGPSGAVDVCRDIGRVSTAAGERYRY